ncbi:MAG: hypothetical protein ACREU6_01555 [Steroidobacteraceae bacterium]
MFVSRPQLALSHPLPHRGHVNDRPPFNSLDTIAPWAAALGFKALQLPSNDTRFFDLTLAASSSKIYCDDLRGLLAGSGSINVGTDLIPSNQSKGNLAMTWHNYIACFFAGIFLTNVVPHFIHGVSGDRFPTPFAKPPGKGLSSPTVNVLWALLNLVIGWLLFQAGRISTSDRLSLVLLFVGIAGMGIVGSRHFASKYSA